MKLKKKYKKWAKNWEAFYKKTFFKFVYIIYKKNIYNTLIINIDQMRIIFILGVNDFSYKIKEVK